MKKISKLIINKVEAQFSSAGDIVLLTHIDPDGDAIGTLLGLYWYLTRRGKKVSMIVPNAIPFFLRWLPGYENIMIAEDNYDKAIEQIRNADLMICVDFNESDRLKTMESEFLQSGAVRILIDHHPDPQNFAHYTISIPDMSSSAEIVYDLIVQSGFIHIIDKTIAECLFTGIMTDTGCFSFNSSKPETYHVIADLLEKGIDKDQIFIQVYDNYSFDRMRLLGYSLDQKMVIIPEYKTAYICLTKDELDRYNHVVGDTEGFVNYPFTIKGIKLTALFIEKEDHIKISFRSRGNFEINKFSEKHFHGGGHKNAAGGESYVSLDKTIEEFKNILPLYSKELLEE